MSFHHGALRSEQRSQIDLLPQYKSSGGCMNYKVCRVPVSPRRCNAGADRTEQVSDDWEENEGCLNYKRGVRSDLMNG